MDRMDWMDWMNQMDQLDPISISIAFLQLAELFFVQTFFSAQEYVLEMPSPKKMAGE